MRISDWSSDVCSSDLRCGDQTGVGQRADAQHQIDLTQVLAVQVDEAVDQTQLDIDSRIGLEKFGQGRRQMTATEGGQIGRASCRERVCQYVKISVVAVSLKKKRHKKRNQKKTT